MLSRATHTSRNERSHLPQEVLSHIFQYLSTDERKVIKLVCRSWLQACCVPSLLDVELLICFGVNKLSDIYELLERSPRGFLSLKFETVNFVNNRSTFWEVNGYRIRSIDFVNCKFLDGTLEKIIVHCVNLIHLSFEYTRQFAAKCTPVPRGRGTFSELPIKEDLDEILRCGIVRENLESLEIIVRNPDRINFSNYIVHQLFSIYPKVRTLKMTCYKYLNLSSDSNNEELPEDIDFDVSMCSMKDRFTFSPVFKYLMAAADGLEKLDIRFPCQQFPLNILQPTLSAMKRLKKLSIFMGTEPLQVNIDILILFSKQLEWLAFNLDSLDDEHYQSVVFQTLLANSNLKYLSVKCHCPFVFSEAIFEKLILTGLKHLDLMVPSISVENPESIPYLLAQNNPPALPSLRLHCTRGLNRDGLSCCLHYFQHLYHLDVFCISDSVFFKTLSKFKMKLKSLSLGLEHDTTFPDHFIIFKNRFNQLTDIEYLHLRGRAGDIFLKCLSAKPILANLKYLFICISNQAFTNAFLRAANGMPFLEGLRIVYEVRDVSFDFCSRLCRRLHRLRYFYCEGDLCVAENRLCTVETYRSLFLVCPSLRVFVIRHVGDFITYFYDVIENQVRMKSPVNQRDDRIVFRRPKIGKLPIQWLQ